MITIIRPESHKELLKFFFHRSWVSEDTVVTRIGNVSVLMASGKVPAVILSFDGITAGFYAPDGMAILSLLIDTQGKAGIFWPFRIFIPRPLSMINVRPFSETKVTLSHGGRFATADRDLLSTTLTMSLIWLLLRKF